jgi:hypothetical protein
MKNLCILVCAIALVGCAGFGGPSGVTGAFPGTIYTQAIYPAYASWGQVEYKRDFDIVGEVNGDAESSSILGIICTGNSGYAKLYEAAKAKGADDVINVKIDTHYSNILGVYSKVITKLSGVAIKWKK